jgi:uroporphyrin-III C-methyltransferase
MANELPPSMNDGVTSNEAAAPAVPDRKSGAAAWWAGLAFVLAALSLGGVAMLWQKLDRAQEELARRSTDTMAEVTAARALVTQADSVMQDLQARLGVAELRLSEVSLQRSQLEELMLSVSRSRDDSLVQDLESAVRLAMQQSQLTGSVQPLVSALQAADQRIQRAAQPRLNPVQRAIARDVERIRAATLVDVPALAMRIDELVRNVDEWPLLNAVGGAPGTRQSALARDGKRFDDKAAASVADVSRQQSDATPAPEDIEEPAREVKAAPAEIGGSSGLGQSWDRLGDWWKSNSTRWLASMRAGAADLVRVSRIDRPEAALLAPEQAFFLRENIKLTLLNARLGLLGRQLDTARADVRTAQALLNRYFDVDSANTRMALAALKQLQEDMRQEVLPRPDETLTALAAAASGR